MRGRLTPEQERVLAGVIAGRHVHDLGAGDLVLSGALVRLGADHVTAVDRIFKTNHAWTEGMSLLGQQFAEIEPFAMDVAFVSWPDFPRPTPGLVGLLAYARTVVYLGSNFDGVCCGSDDLWGHLIRRTVAVHVPDRVNSLIVYGPLSVGRRDLLREEYAATHRDGEYLSYA